MANLNSRSSLAPEFLDATVFPVQTQTLQISELPLTGILRVQGRKSDSAFVSAVEDTLKLKLPAPSRTESQADIMLTWAGPNEYLCFCALDNETKHEEALKSALDGKFAAVTLVSDSRFGICISGTSAATFVSQSCSIDVDPATFPVGSAVTTRFANLPAILIHRTLQEYCVYFDIGFVEYMLRWLVAESNEYRHTAA
jgi:sarcosine oxidase, subunit gamma